MRDELTYAARRVFAEFIDAFEKHEGRRDWMQDFKPALVERMGLTYGQLEGALELLESEGLIERVTEDYCELTDLGYRACRHRALIDEVLGPPTASRGPSIVIHAQQVALGNGNHLQANSDQVIAALVQQIQASSAPEETKSRWLETLKDVAGFAIAEGLKMVIESAVK